MDYKVTDTELTAVANAIRSRGGTSAPLEWDNGFVSAIGAIGNAYSAGDEGKVVENGALVAQTSLDINENGTYDTTKNNEVVVNVGGAGKTLIANWDFSQSHIDTINGLEATTYSTQTTAEGEQITTTYGYINFPIEIKANARAYEIEVGNTNFQANAVNRFININGQGLTYMGNNVWGFSNGNNQRATDTNITDVNYFKNSTVRIEVELLGNWKIYKDGVLVYSPDVAYSFVNNTKDLSIGSTSSSCSGATIKGVKVYA